MSLLDKDSERFNSEHSGYTVATSTYRGSKRASRSKEQNKQKLAVTMRGNTTQIRRSLDDAQFIAFDIETTGGNPEKNGITEIFAMRYRSGKVVDTFYSLINPEISIPPIVRKMTGITNRLVKDAPKIHEIMHDFVEFIGNDVLVSHNTIGDMKFLRYFSEQVTGKMITNYYLCTHLLIEKLVPKAPDKSLKGLAKYFDLPADGKLHRAEADGYLTLELFKVLLRKLSETGISYVMDAIRFQGDYESGMRIGWGVEKEKLAELPRLPGVFYLYDHLGNLTFLAAAHDLSKEVKKLQRFSSLPRQLLKSVLASTELRYEITPTAFAAALLEAEGLEEHKLRFDPSNWHQRTANFLYLKREEDGCRITTGPLSDRVVVALGPIRGGREASMLLENLSEVFSKKLTKKGLSLDDDKAKLACEFLNGRPVEKGIVEKALSLLSFWKVDPNLEKIKQQLSELAIPSELSHLEVCSGIMAVAALDGWHVYIVACGIPIGEFQLPAGDLLQLLKQNDQHINLYKRIRLAIFARRRSTREMPSIESHIINRTFWWAFFGERHENVRLFPVDELIQI